MGWYEESGSRSATIKRLGAKDTSTCEVKYRATGFTDDTAVHAQAVQFFNTYRMRVLAGITMLVKSYDVSHLGGDVWEVTATYESEGQDGGPSTTPAKRGRSFDTTGATTHLTCGFAERRYPTTAVNMNCAIEADSDSVKGVDIIVPALSWQETYDVPSGVISDTYIKAVAGLTGCVNSDGFRGFQPGEVLFAGCSGSQQWDSEKGDGPWSLTYKFIASQNVDGLTVGGISGVTKKGHEYLWVRYSGDDTQSALVRKPIGVYVNEVYRKAALSGLGLG